MSIVNRLLGKLGENKTLAGALIGTAMLVNSAFPVSAQNYGEPARRLPIIRTDYNKDGIKEVWVEFRGKYYLFTPFEGAKDKPLNRKIKNIYYKGPNKAYPKTDVDIKVVDAEGTYSTSMSLSNGMPKNHKAMSKEVKKTIESMNDPLW